MYMRWLKSRIHVSWLVAVCCIGVVTGVTLCVHIRGDFSSVAWLLTGTALALFGLTVGRAWVVPVVLVAGCAIGLWRGSIGADDTQEIKRQVGKSVQVRGTISEDGDVNRRGRTTLRLVDLTVDGQPMGGRAWVSVDRTDKVRRSDIVTVEGSLSDGFGSFNVGMYDARLVKVQRPVPGDVALTVRDWFSGGVEQAIGSPQSDLGLGYLLGQRRGLPPDLDAALQVAGLTHVVVASGYNLTILVRFARRAFAKVSKYLSFISASAITLGFIAVTGLSPSMSRAGLVAGLSLLAWYYGRRFHPFILLSFAMAITVLLQPSFAWGDVGWQLSFAAFGGVMIMAPLLSAYFFGDKAERPLRRIFIETIAAQICTLPILLVSFGQLSIIAPLANMLVLPLVPLAMALTFVAGVCGLAVPGLATVAGAPAELVLSYMTTTITIAGSLPWASADVTISLLLAVVVYALIAAACVYMWRVTRVRLSDTSLVE